MFSSTMLALGQFLLLTTCALKIGRRWSTSTSKAFYTASPQRCLSSASRVSGISSTPLPQLDLSLTKPTLSVYSGTKFAVRAISEGLRQEAVDKLRVTIISPGFVHTDFAESLTNLKVKAQIVDTMDKMAISPDAIARAIAFAIEQPADVDVGEIVIRPTAQG